MISNAPLDARQRRTQRALSEAILSLATDQSASAISMAQLARTAGVHRSTVYQHVSSPSVLLCSVMSNELDQVRSTMMSQVQEMAIDEVMRLVILDVLAHLERHRSIYLRELVEPGNHLHAMLRDHFAVSVGGVMEAQNIGPEESVVERRMMIELTSRWIADASVGAMTVWLRREVRDREAYLRAHAVLLPSWWPSPRLA